MKKTYTFIMALAIFTFAGIQSASAQLYINEFMASNDSAFAGPEGDYPDWIEIYNAGDEAVDLSGYFMADDLVDPSAMYAIPSTYPDSVTVPAHGYILFYANKGQETSVLNLNFKLSGGGEQVGLWDPDQTVLDSITYGDQTTDVSYGRYPDGIGEWAFMIDFTPGEANLNPNPSTPKLYINEFMASNDAAFPGPQGDYPDWIEIYNDGDEAVDLSGYFLADDLADPEAMYAIPSTYPDSVTVPAHGFILFYANKGQESSVLNLNFKLSGGGEQVGLWNPDSTVLDSITYGEQTTDISFGRYPDAGADWEFMPTFTPGTTNVANSIIENDEAVLLSQNMPNPFRGTTTIRFNLASSQYVTINVYSVTGSLVTVLTNRVYSAGEHNVEWNASNLPAGYYLYSIETSIARVVKKASVIK